MTFFPDFLNMANKSLMNDTDVDQDDDERENKFREVQTMLREMRYRSCVGQMKMAEKEKTEAEKCKRTQNTSYSLHMTQSD